ncbi:MAG: GMC family oxidoreductase [Polyangiales bacterium]
MSTKERTRHVEVVIVGGGVAGAIAALELGRRGPQVLVLEAGLDSAMSPEGYAEHHRTWLAAGHGAPNGPFPRNPNAPHPLPFDLGPPRASDAYLEQRGADPYASVYTRYLGGTTLTWLGTSVRLLRSDFELQRRYGVGVDWPLGVDALAAHYLAAERELGVAGDADAQRALGAENPEGGTVFGADDEYPFEPVATSWVDQYMAAGLADARVDVSGTSLPVVVTPTPQARNTRPNPRYDGGRGHTPENPRGDTAVTARCDGYASCIPLCPVQAKYTALRTLRRCHPARVEVRARSVVSRLLADPETGRIRALVVKRYERPDDPTHTVERITADLVVLAAGAVENAKLLLASGLANASDQVGRNLMDHPFPMVWGLAPEALGTFRGPSSTAGIETLRDGPFRRAHGAFRVEISNWGWDFPTGAPGSDVDHLVDAERLLGRDLRRALFDRVQRQVRLGFLVEQEPDPANRVRIDPSRTDALGEPRPVIHYALSDYTRRGIVAAVDAGRQIFRALGIEDHTAYNADDPRSFVHDGARYAWRGAGHAMGTHRMGTSRTTAVTDSHLRCFDHPNLFLLGAGSFPTGGTGNPTLTLAALAFRAVEAMHRDLTHGVPATS